MEPESEFLRASWVVKVKCKIHDGSQCAFWAEVLVSFYWSPENRAEVMIEFRAPSLVKERQWPELPVEMRLFASDPNAAAFFKQCQSFKWKPENREEVRKLCQQFGIALQTE